MLEGLQAGQNITWDLLQKNITQFLDINFHQRRKWNKPSVHSGNVQLRFILIRIELII
jgi:hypothetical protein